MGMFLCYKSHYPRWTGALSYAFSTPRHSSFRWIGAKECGLAAKSTPSAPATVHRSAHACPCRYGRWGAGLLQRSSVLKRPAAVPGGFLRRAAALLLLTGALAPLLFAGGAGVWAWLFRVLSSLLTASTRPDMVSNSLPEAPPQPAGQGASPDSTCSDRSLFAANVGL